MAALAPDAVVVNGLVERAEQAAEARADGLRAAVRARLAKALPGVAMQDDGDRILLSGRGLLRRWLARADLRDWRGTGS